MQALFLKYPRAFMLAILLHIIFAVFLIASFDWTHQPDIVVPEENVVQATAIDEKQVQAELDKIKAAEARKHKKEQDRINKLEKKADQAKKARELEQQRLKDAAEKHKQEMEKIKKAEQSRLKAEQEAKAAESEKKRLQEEQRKAEAEQKKAAELARKAKEEAERALEEQRKADEERMRQQMLQEEQKNLQAQHDKQVQGVIRDYQARIKQKVERNWNKPPGVKEGMSCDILVRIMPGGNVLEARVTKSSGDPVFDRSVENAVRRAAPLPLPQDPSLFKNFRELEFNFNPKG